MEKAGDELAGRYVLRDRLGAGGMGVVYRADDERLGRAVAVKVLPASDVGDHLARDRLIREARAAAALEHTGIVQVFDVGETDDGGAFLVMELVRGKTVRRLMEEGTLDREIALRVIREAAHALLSAHLQGFVHRDVKPDNIMVRDDGRVVVLDFGLVKSVLSPLSDTKTPDTPTLKELTRSGAIVGTPAYLAPEQARGESGPATDQWALAITAYELLAGRLPWEGDDATYMLAQILMDEPPPASESGQVAADVDPVLARALSKNPTERYDDIAGFTDALVAACGGVVAEAPGPTHPAPRPRTSGTRALTATPRVKPTASEPPSRRRWAAAAALVLAGALAVALGAVYWGSSAGEVIDTPEATVSPLADPNSVFACPVFEAEGVDEPSGWLGAAASLSVCSRIGILMGGDDRRMLAPAHLLDLPRSPTHDFPTDPYGEGDARSRTLSAASERSAVWLDGRVRRTPNATWELEVRLVSPSGLIAQTSTTGEALHLAADSAVRQLIESGAVPAAERLVEDVRRWTLLDDPEHLLVFHELDDVMFTRVGGVAFCENAFEQLTPIQAALIDGDCARFVDRPDVDIALDHSSAYALGVTGLAHVGRVPGADPSAIADELAAARVNEPDPRGRAWLALYEGFARMHGGQIDLARPILRIASERMPLHWNARALNSRALTDESARAALRRVMRAWRPDLADAWWQTSGDLAWRLVFVGRAHALAPRHERWAILYSQTLIESERLEEARSVAARLRSDGMNELAGRFIDGLLDMRLGRFHAAEENLRASLASSTRPFGVLNGGIDVFETWMSLAVHLGHGRELADELIREYLLADPPRTYQVELRHEPALALACAYASPEVAEAGLDAIAHLRRTHSSGRSPVAGVDTLMAGARLHARGDVAGAVAAWRSLVRQLLGRYLPASAFDAAGARDLARHLDRPFLEDQSYGGAHPAQWREALRCEAEGNHECARLYASGIVDSWSTADVEVPAVAEMRSLLARLPE